MTEKTNKPTVIVVGHKNPDTDSICSAIAYAYLKNQIDPDYNYVACRAGTVNAETSYVLEHFKAGMPVYVDNIGTRVKDMEIREVAGNNKGISVKEAYTLMKEQNVFTLPLTNKKGKLEGLITINDIAKSYMEEYDSAIVSRAKTPYRNIMKTLEAQMIVGDEDAVFDKGKVVIAAANPDVMENYIEKDDMVILGNRYEGQLCAVEMDAGCIVVCLGAPVSRTIQAMAKEHGTTILVTPLDTYTVARLINQSMPVDFFMKKDDLITFRKTDYTEDIRETMSKRRFRDFPVLDKQGHYIGMISRRNLLGVRRRRIILVDHNEEEQAVDHIGDSELLEIIDHHRLGTMETMNPVYFRNQPVGCTATIIYQMFVEKNVPIPPHIAGLMCAAIMSDTLLFRSPTCTGYDREAAAKLEEIAGIDADRFAMEMFAAGSELSTKSEEEILYQDYKKFDFREMKVGIGQITSVNGPELERLKERMTPFLRQTLKSKGLDMLFFMLTDIIDESTQLLFFGEKAKDLVEEAFPDAEINGECAKVVSLVSRKKQVVPALMSVINRPEI